MATMTAELGLETRARKVVALMSILTEVDMESPLARAGEIRAPNSAGSRIPRGVTLRPIEGPPPTARSLAEHWAWRFQNAHTDHDLWRLCVIAEREYLTARYGGQVCETQEAMAERVLRDYAGIAAEEVALLENTNERWVRKLRIHSGRNPDTGILGEDRATKARDMRANGASIRMIATHLGVGRTTVERILKGEAA